MVGPSDRQTGDRRWSGDSMIRQVRSLFCGLCLAAGASVLLGGAPQVFRSGVQTVAIYATVLDRDSRLVTDLEQQHFVVLDNLKPQPLTVFKSDVQPITV